mmetsp:Transcript_29301/g.67279  ORF Transcript_29301/g.67279 Transcript_29301/m.67279 type:complete len:92 (+) Transcript_29301:325-600(+)
MMCRDKVRDASNAAECFSGIHHMMKRMGWSAMDRCDGGERIKDQWRPKMTSQYGNRGVQNTRNGSNDACRKINHVQLGVASHYDGGIRGVD